MTTVIAVVTFAVGLSLGAFAVLSTGGGGSSTTTVVSQPSPTQAPTPAPSPSTVTLALGSDCMDALAQAQSVVGDVNSIGEALSRFDAAALDRVVRQLQGVTGGLQSSLAGCNTTISLPQVTPSPSPVSVTPSSTTASQPSG